MTYKIIDIEGIGPVYGEKLTARRAGANPSRGLRLPSTGKHRLCHDTKAETGSPGPGYI